MPLPDNAIFTLAKALAKVADYETKPLLIPSTKEFFLALAKTSQPPMSTYFSNLVNSKDPELVRQADREISKDPLLHAIMRNTIAPVLLNAGFRGNIIPSSAEATINFRMIPGTNTADLIGEMQRVVNDPLVEIVPVTVAMGGTRPPAELDRLHASPHPVRTASCTGLWRANPKWCIPKRRLPPTFSRRVRIPSPGAVAVSRFMESTLIRLTTKICPGCTATTSVWRWNLCAAGRS